MPLETLVEARSFDSIEAAPVVLVGTAAAAISTIDPIIFGAVPAVSAREGEPAAWYVLARWDW